MELFFLPSSSLANFLSSLFLNDLASLFGRALSKESSAADDEISNVALNSQNFAFRTSTYADALEVPLFNG